MAPPGHDHVNVVVTDMERSIRFYAALFGLRTVMDRPLEGEWFEQVTGLAMARARCVILAGPDGGCRIELLQFESPAPAQPAPLSALGLRHVAVRVDDLDRCLAILESRFGQTARAVEVPGDIVRGGKRMCYVRDPDGAIVELCQYGLEQPEFR